MSIKTIDVWSSGIKRTLKTPFRTENKLKTFGSQKAPRQYSVTQPFELEVSAFSCNNRPVWNLKTGKNIISISTGPIQNIKLQLRPMHFKTLGKINQTLIMSMTVFTIL